MSIWTKANSSWNSLISNVPICWNILFDVSWNIFLTSYTIYIVMAASDCTTIWIDNFITVFINISYCCLLCIWCVSNHNFRINVINCYFRYCFYTSLTWSVACYFRSLNFNKAASSPRVVCNFLSHFIVSSCSSQFSLLT